MHILGHLLTCSKLIPHFSSTPTETPVPESHLFSRHEVVVTQRTVGGSFTWRGGWKRNRTPLSHQIYNYSKCPPNTEEGAVIFYLPERATWTTQFRFLLSCTSYSIRGRWEISYLWNYKSLTDVNYVRRHMAWNSGKRKKNIQTELLTIALDSKYGSDCTELWKSTDFWHVDGFHLFFSQQSDVYRGNHSSQLYSYGSKQWQ